MINIKLAKIISTLLLSLGLNIFYPTVWASDKIQQTGNASHLPDSSGIRFQEDKSWNDVLALARAENKLVFVDIYTSWCVPCKKMSTEVFTDKKVGEKYNSNFVNYKVDAEKGEGMAIAKKYSIQAYPTYLFVDSTGTLIYTVTSYMPPSQFIQQANIAINERKDPKPYPLWEREYESKKTNPEFLFSFMQKRSKLRKDNSELIEEYFSLLPEHKWLTKENTLLFSKTQLKKINTPLFNFMASHIEEAENLIRGQVSPGIIHDILFSAQIQALNECISNMDLEKFEKDFLKANKIMPASVSTKPWFQKSNDDYWRLYFFQQTKNYNKFLRLAVPYYDSTYLKLKSANVFYKDSVLLSQALSVYYDTALTKPENRQGLVEMTKEAFKNYFSNRLVSELSSAAKIALFNSNSSIIFLRAIKWLQKANEIKQNVEDMYTQGLLHYRLNRPLESIRWLEKAVSFATDDKLKSKINTALTSIKERKSFENIANTIK